MPKVSMFIYAEDSKLDMPMELQNVPQNGVLQGENRKKPNMIIINPQHIFAPMFVPGQFSFAISFGILDLDTYNDHVVRYTFSGPNGNELIIDTGDNIKIPNQFGNPNDLPQEMRGFIMNMEFKNVVFKVNGEYKSEIFFDGSSLGVFPINVRGKNTNA